MFSSEFSFQLSLRPRRAASLLGLVSVGLLAGCGGGGGNGNSSPTVVTPITTGVGGVTTGNGGATGGTPASVSAKEANGLTATLSENTTTVAVGGTVTYTLTLTNNTGAVVTVNAVTSTQIFTALSIRNASGALVYIPVPGSPPLQTVLLAPGQTLTTTQAVSAFSSAGTYSATGVFDDSTPTSVGPLTVTAQ